MCCNSVDVDAVSTSCYRHRWTIVLQFGATMEPSGKKKTNDTKTMIRFTPIRVSVGIKE